MIYVPRLKYPEPDDFKQTYLSPEKCITFTFNVDLSTLDEGYRKALPKLVQVLDIMDRIFLMQDHPQSISLKDRLLRDAAMGSEAAKVSLEVFNMFNGPEGVTYQNDVVPLFANVRQRPAGGTVYTEGVTAEEIDNYLSAHPEKRHDFNKINTVIRRVGKGFSAVPYEIVYRNLLAKASVLLVSAAGDVPSKSFEKYLRSRAIALISGNYFESDCNFVRVTDSPIEFIAGPLESYHDMVQSKKAFYAGILSMKDPVESERVSIYLKHLQTLEEMLPQSRERVKNMAEISIPVAVVDIIAMSGEMQAKRPNIIVGQTLPNDDRVLAEVGRKIYIYKNVLEGFERNEKFVNMAIDPSIHRYLELRGKINSVVGHEVSHSLGPKETVIIENGKAVKVHDALGFYNGILEELKSDLLSVFNMPYLVSKGLYSEEEAREVYAEQTLMRNLPVYRPEEGKDTHYIGNLMKLNYFMNLDAVTLVEGKFSLNFGKVHEATGRMVAEVLSIQSEGNRDRAMEFIDRWSFWGEAAEYSSKVANESGVKLYKAVRQPLVEQLLRH